MDDMQDLPIYPIWREVLQRWPEYGFTWGDIIPHKWYFEVFDLPEITGTMTVDQAQRIELKMLGYRTELHRALLAEHRLYLASVPGVGYEIITPGEQSRRVDDDFHAELRKIARKRADGLRYVRLDMLSDSERRENADMLARAASFARWIKDKVAGLLPGETKE